LLSIAKGFQYSLLHRRLNVKPSSLLNGYMVGSLGSKVKNNHSLNVLQELH